MTEMIEKTKVLKALDTIREEVWGIDIPSPTVPEYVEHHEQMQDLLKIIDNLRKDIERA